MCGILGWVKGAGGSAALPSFGAEEMRSLRHRGPDDSGVERVAVNDCPGVFAHLRLSIQDPSAAGHQPMCRGRWTVVYNGEIYNAPDLRVELEARGCAFASHCDTEVLCWALERWGLESLQKLNGMFAFGATDGERLVLVRDRLGIKPLYYWQAHGALAFASELKALERLPGFEKRIAGRALEHYLAFGYIPAPLTIYENCFKVLPGTILTWQDGRLQSESYWDLPLAEAGRGATSPEEALAHLETLLADAVRLRLLADVPLGAFLSGGIDSSVVAALAQQQSSDRLRTFTIGFDFSEYDESAQAEAVARHLGADHTCVTITARDVLDLVPKIPAIYDEPFADSSALPAYLLSQITRRDVTVALSGDGGDEQLFGYNRYVSNLRLAWIDRLPRRLRQRCARLVHRLFGETAFGRWGKAGAYDGFDEGTLLFAGIFSRMRFDQLAGRPFCLDGTRYRQAYRRMAACNVPQALIGSLLDLTHYLPDDILCKMDRASMQHALEVRVPLLDHRIVEFTHRLPLDLRYRGGERKVLLKRLIERHVPRRLWDRPKQGFSVPLDHWFRKELRPLLRNFLNAERVREQGVFCPSFVEKLIQDHMDGRKDNQYYLWTLLVFELWLEETGATCPSDWPMREAGA